MLVNCTESPYQEWTQEMLSKVKDTYGIVVNHTLPKISKNMIDEDIDLVAEEHYEKIITIISEHSPTVTPSAVFLNDNLQMHKRVKYFLEETHIESIDIDIFKEDGDF